MTELFSKGFKTDPYWWDQSPPRDSKLLEDLPANADVVVVGSGYTGLHAAIQTARAGLSTVVLDACSVGWGCSTRNGGQISTSVKPSFAALAERYGCDTALSIQQEGQASLDHIHTFVGEENIDCDLIRSGRFHGAHSVRAYAKLTTEVERESPGFSTNAYLVEPSEMSAELGTNSYYGGIVYPHHSSIDPGRYHAGLLGVALNAGVHIYTQCRVNALSTATGIHHLSTDRGGIKAPKVVMATNGHTGKLTGWLQRRVIPIGSYVIATDIVAPDLMNRLMPTNRVLSDTRKLVYYYRPSPDRKRIIFGGRVSLSETDPKRSARRLHKELVRLFPELESIKISHSWVGFVGYSFDSLMHCGERQGVSHAMAYCGSGVGMAGYLGMRMGKQIAGIDDEGSVFSRIPFPTRPLYTGNPWFLAPSIFAYRLMDRLS